MVHTSIRMELPAGGVREALDILRPVAERARIEPGCLSCRIYRDVQQEHTIMLEALWSNWEMMQQHLSSADYQRVLLVVEMARGNPEIRFSTVTDVRGVEAVVEARRLAQRVT
jgi:quinol monooxygenase YgiN